MNHLIKFQQDNGLFADGIIGRKTATKMKEVWGINDNVELAHLLANVHHETGGFTHDTENLNYSSAGLLKVFPKYFKDSITAREYANNPEKIANKVYSNRMGNGSEFCGDGWKFRGRGAIQLTGKDNYELFATFMKDPDILINPNIVSSQFFWETALFYFTVNNLWHQMKHSDPSSVKAIRKAINGGYNGLDEVQKLFTKYLKQIQ